MTGIWLVSYIMLWILFLIVAIVLLIVLRNIGVIYESLSSKQPTSTWSDPNKLLMGERIPEVDLSSLSGESVPLSQFIGTKMAISIISPNCGSCRALLEQIAKGTWALDPVDTTLQDVAIVSVGAIDRTNEIIRQIDFPSDIPVLVDPDARVSNAWGVSVTPTTIIVDDQLRVMRQVVGLGGEQLRKAA